jgi:hypothetical protein
VLSTSVCSACDFGFSCGIGMGQNAAEIFKMFDAAFGEQTLGTSLYFSPSLLLFPSLEVV